MTAAAHHCPAKPIAHTSRPPPSGATQLGPADPAERLTVTLLLRRRAGLPPPQAGVPQLSRAAYTAVHGATDDDLERVAQFATANGLPVIERHAGRRTLRLAGTVAQMQHAFALKLNRYRHGAITYRGYDGPVHIPASLADIVLHVVGLDDRPLGRPMLQRGTPTSITPDDPAAPVITPLSPTQVAALYDFPAGSAAGQTIGILEFGGGYRADDVATYFNTVANSPEPSITFVSIDGATNMPPAPIAAFQSALHGYFGADTSQHVNYLANDGHLHELYATPGGAWYDNDLTADTASTPPALGAAITGYWGLDNSQHVFFLGTDGHVHELYLEPGSSWRTNDLTVSAGAALPRAGSPLDAYWQQDNSQHVFFLSADGHVHELYLAPGRAWEDNDLTTAASCPSQARPGSPLAAFYGTDTSQHVHFIDAAGNVWELYANPGEGWRSNNLTAAAHAPLPASASPLTGYWQADGGQHVDFIDANGHVQELYLATGAAWECNDITVLAQAPVAAAPGSALSGYFGLDTSQHLQFIGTDGHLHELYANQGAGWASNDLTATASKSILPVAGSPLTGYWQQDNSQHVDFIGTDGQIHELYLDPGAPWVTNDLNFNLAQAENALDIAIAGSVAPGANLVIYRAPGTEQGWIDALTTALHDSVNTPSVLSISWGFDENVDALFAITPILAESIPLGVTVFAASGDAGSQNPPQVMYPASDPSVTGCGGTTVFNVAGSAFSQTGWSGSGGGFSAIFATPSWQAGALTASNRGVPDVSGNGNFNTGYALVLGQATNTPWGGTSAVAPLYAALVALLNASRDTSLGWLNPTLYSLAGSTSLEDVTTGNNGVWNAQIAWDAVTGLGSINGSAFAAALTTDPTVWLNTGSHIFHLKGDRWYGKTHAGEYLPEITAVEEGNRETRNRQ